MFRLFFISFLFLGCQEKYGKENSLEDNVVLKGEKYVGYVEDFSNVPLDGVSVTLRYHNQNVFTNQSGEFNFNAIENKNDLIILKKDGYYDGIFTFNPLNPIEKFKMKKKTISNVRFLFTGDLSFARRFMNPNSLDRTVDILKEDVDGAVLKVSNLYESGQALIEPVQPLFLSVDFPTVNFESIATQKESTLDEIHPTKDFAYYTDSSSIRILKDLNIDFVTLGNNHIYDYNQVGLSDTIDALTNYNISFSGAGETVEKAFLPYRTNIKGHPFSFIGATSIRGDKHQMLYVANTKEYDPNYEVQGGAANAHDIESLSSRLKEENSLSYFPIYQFHGGIEYTFAPNSVALRLMRKAVENSAKLVISHHPHTAQGYGKIDGVLVAYGLGNFIFDQDRLDTLLSHIFVCDIEDENVTYARGYPIYIENYIPKLLTGDLANRFIRHISEASRNGSTLNETRYSSDFLVFPYNYKEYLALNNNYDTQTINKEINFKIEDKGYSIIDLRGLVSSDFSLSYIENRDELNISIGRDLLWFGSFEDNDIDSDFYENSIWNFDTDVSSSNIAYKGNSSANIFRDKTHSNNALLYFGRRTRVIGDARNRPNKNLSFLGYFKGKNSRPFEVEMKYYASIGEKEFGNSMLIEESGGTFDWKQIEKTIPFPEDINSSTNPYVYLAENPRALKFFIRMQPVEKGEANLYIDDLAIISWEEFFTKKEIEVSTPHKREFLKIKGDKGEYKLNLVFKRYFPK